jgi:hypothetical protein
MTAEAAARCLDIPEWMFDRVVCCGVTRADSPRVNSTALHRLKALIVAGSGTATGTMIEARPSSSLEGEADASRESPTSSPKFSV